MQTDFRTAFDLLNNLGMLFKLRDVAVGGAVFNVIADFVSGRLQRVVIDGVPSEDIRVFFWCSS